MVSCVFVLSAIHPDLHARVLSNIAQVTKPSPSLSLLPFFLPHPLHPPPTPFPPPSPQSLPPPPSTWPPPLPLPGAPPRWQAPFQGLWGQRYGHDQVAQGREH